MFIEIERNMGSFRKGQNDMGILFLKGGTYTTIQDNGRVGYQNVGFSVSGVMDKKAYRLANMLLDNHPKEAVLEFCMTGPCIKFLSDTFISITGADFSPKVNGFLVLNYKAIQIHKNDVLEFASSQNGMWGYLAFAGGMNSKPVMGSSSTHVRCKVGGFHGRCIKKGDYIGLKELVAYLPQYLSRTVPTKFLENYQSEKIRVICGPQNDAFTAKGIDTFFSSEYKVTEQCDRMGYRLDGNSIEHKECGADIISDGISLGAIQIPSQGKPIIMLADRQTTGGYTKIATVISLDIPILVQKRAGDKVYFEEVTIHQATELLKKQSEEFHDISQEIHKPCKEVLNPRVVAQRLRVLFE
ncbi:MAG: biotin-dependent carboxyltransferase family protein [Lachnotalea sp.]